MTQVGILRGSSIGRDNMTKETKAYQAHLKALAEKVVTKTNIIGIRKLLNSTSRMSRGWPVSGNPQGTPDQADALRILVRQQVPQVEGALVESGKELLRAKRYKKRWTAGQQQMIDNLEGFRLVDFVEIGNAHWCPVYATIGDGEAFKFYNIPWQSGGNGPEVIG
jgi:hypothetical protein